MAFIGSTNLKKLLDGSGVIDPFSEENIKNGSYELSLGSQVFQTGVKSRTVKNLSKKEKIYIDPGQFALLLTEEKVKIPKDKIAFISIKARAKFNGLVNVSGFHVDPGFEGQLLFSVYNAGPSTIVLSQGTPYFPIWFSELNETQEYNGTHGGQSEIPDEPVKALCQGELASPSELSKRIDALGHLKTKIEWVVLAIFGAIITASVGLSVRLWTENAQLKNAFEYGYIMKGKDVTSDSTFQKIQDELKTFRAELDSVKKHNSENKNQSSGKSK